MVLTSDRSSCFISVCMPTYKGVAIIRPALDSLLRQTYRHFEIILGNDSQNDAAEMAALVASYNDPRLRLVQNPKNLGYPANNRNIVAQARHQILFFMCQDDILLADDIFAKCVAIFAEHPDVGAITRPYYWYSEAPSKPIRHIDKCEKRIIGCDDDPKYFLQVIATLGQLSGLVMRKHLITHTFAEWVFVAHIYPFLSIMRTHKVYFWPDYMVAVWTEQSQTMHRASIYRPSPTWTWVDMFRRVFPEPQFARVREAGIKCVASHYVGLLQIRNYGLTRDLLADIGQMIRCRPQNLLAPRFWFFVIGVLATPRFLLRRLVDFYKSQVNARRLKHITAATR